MKTANLFKHWWAILVQGIVMITLSLVIFNHPQLVLEALALWLGFGFLITGLIGGTAYFITPEGERDVVMLLGSIAIFVLGLVMVFEKLAAMRAITLIFGLQVAVIGFLLLFAGWNARKAWPNWWMIGLIGFFTLIMGINSVVDLYSGAKNISIFMGFPILVSGVGLVLLAFFKKKMIRV